MDSRHKQEIKQYGKKDVIIAFCVFLLWAAVYLFLIDVLTNAIFETPLTLMQIQFVRGLFTFAFGAVLVSTAILTRKQGFASIGIHKENFWSALRIGLLFSIIPLAFGISAGIFYEGEYVGFRVLMFNLLIAFLFAAPEDISFVGFIQTRLSGVFKSDKAALCVGAAMFAIMHIPPWLRTGQISFDDLFLFVFMIIYWLVMHIVLVCIYRKYQSLIPVVTLHTLTNFSAYSLWIFSDGYAEYALEWISLAFPVLVVAVGIWALYLNRKGKKHAV
ncbi:MAG: CPBP family intramembrane metalloprotease [Firmicutes bacterium]|nr:CPBP family intramembrane metalloprotease [Bacillota bacterium]